jgi:uncharacterized protein (TIGR00251 family)
MGFMRLVEVRVVPKSSSQKVEVIETNKLKVWVHSAPLKGRANQETREVLAKHFGLARAKVNLIKGERSRTKTFALDMPQDNRKITDYQ